MSSYVVIAWEFFTTCSVAITDITNVNISFCLYGIKPGILNNVLVNFAKLTRIRNKGFQNKLM